MFVFLGWLLGADTGALIELGKMCGAVGVDRCRFLVGEFDAAEKLHQACFTVVASSHNALINTSFYIETYCSAVITNIDVKNARKFCVKSHSCKLHKPAL